MRTEQLYTLSNAQKVHPGLIRRALEAEVVSAPPVGLASITAAATSELLAEQRTLHDSSASWSTVDMGLRS